MPPDKGQVRRKIMNYRKEFEEWIGKGFLSAVAKNSKEYYIEYVDWLENKLTERDKEK